MSIKPEDITVIELHDHNVTAAESQAQIKQIANKLIELIRTADESD